MPAHEGQQLLSRFPEMTCPGAESHLVPSHMEVEGCKGEQEPDPVASGEGQEVACQGSSASSKVH